MTIKLKHDTEKKSYIMESNVTNMRTDKTLIYILLKSIFKTIRLKILRPSFPMNNLSTFLAYEIKKKEKKKNSIKEKNSFGSFQTDYFTFFIYVTIYSLYAHT